MGSQVNSGTQRRQGDNNTGAALQSPETPFTRYNWTCCQTGCTAGL